MNPNRFGFEAGAAPAKSATRRQTPDTVPAAMRAGADAKRDDPQSDQPIEEPGYGHGV